MVIAISSRSLFSILVGIISGLIALLALEIIHFILISAELEMFISRFYINEIGEEAVKLFSIFFVFNLLGSNKKNWFWLIFNAFLVGFGFGIFEIALISLSGGSSELIGLMLILGIHSLTSIFLGIAVLFWISVKSIPFFIVFVFIATIIHIVYNIFALNFY